MSRRKHIRWVASAALLASVVISAPAHAEAVPLPTPQTMAADFPVCTKKATPADEEVAKSKFIAGRQDYEEGVYDNAIRRFKNAYDLDCSKAELLLIISSAYEKRSDQKAALAALEVYTQRVPKDAPDMQNTLVKIDNLKREIAAKSAPSQASPKEENREHTIFPWLVAGFGVLAVGAGIVVLATAGDYPSDCNPDTGKCSRRAAADIPSSNPPLSDEAKIERDLTERQSEAGTVRGQTNAGIGIIIGGSILAVGGVVWHFLEPTGPKASSRIPGHFMPAVAPGYGGIAYGLKF